MRKPLLVSDMGRVGAEAGAVGSGLVWSGGDEMDVELVNLVGQGESGILAEGAVRRVAGAELRLARIPRAARRGRPS